jgi:hypothetical protein
MLRGRAGAAPVVDRDERDAGDVRRVGDHDRYPPLEHALDARMPFRQGVDEAGVHERRVHRAGGGLAAAERHRQQRERDAGLLRLDREAAQRADRGRVAERVGQALGEEHADRAGAAGAQGPAGRVGPRVAQLGGEREHALAQRRVQLVGPVERVGGGGARDPERVGEGLERHPAAVALSHAPEATSRASSGQG